MKMQITMGNEILVPKNLHVLSLEDSIMDYEIICEKLENAGYNLEISRVDTEAEFSEQVQNNKYDLILADFNLPSFDAFGALKICNEYCPQVPFICVSGSIGEIMAIELLKQGAVDYVIKDRIERLPFAITRALDEVKIKLEHIAAHEALRKSEERLRDIIFSSADWVWEVDEQGKYTYSSQRDIDLFGVAPEEIIGKTPFDFMSPDEANRVGVLFAEIAANKWPIKDLENWNIGKNGEPICLLTNGLPIVDKEGRLKGYRGVDKNITERKLVEQELILAKDRAETSDRLKTAFLNNISHEIRTPLNGILGFSQILTDQNLTQEEKEEYLIILNKSSERLLNTVTSFIDISLVASGNQKVNKRTVYLESILSIVLKSYNDICKSKKIDLNLALPDPNGNTLLFTDEVLLSKILHHLVDNAVKFTSEGKVDIGCQILEKEFLFSVKDTGVGISAENQLNIFKNFVQEEISYSRGYEGCGLGLSIASGLIELLDGRIWMESEKGKGSIFYFTIPRLRNKNDNNS